MLLKVAMLLACCRDDMKLEFTVDDLEMAKVMLADIKPKIQRLTAGIGENANASISVLLMEAVNKVGFMGESDFQRLCYRHAKGGNRDLNDILEYLQKAGQIVVAKSPTGQRTLFTPKAYETYRKAHADAQRK
jgi:hypothetical protein